MPIKVNQKNIDFLVKKDFIFEKLYKRYGLIEIDGLNDLFQSIVFHIIGQMLSARVANVIEKRVLNLCQENITTKQLLKLSREELRSCGLSYSKCDYILKFANEYEHGVYDFSILDSLNDLEAIAYFKKIDGVGQWTAEMLCLFSLGRENIFSYDDVALKNGIMKAKGYKTLSKKRFEMLRKKYSPFCSYAALYFYKVNDDKEYFTLCED